MEETVPAAPEPPLILVSNVAILVGLLLVAVAVAGLAGVWWAVLAAGAESVAAGVAVGVVAARAR